MAIRRWEDLIAKLKPDAEIASFCSLNRKQRAQMSDGIEQEDLTKKTEDPDRPSFDPTTNNTLIRTQSPYSKDLFAKLSKTLSDGLLAIGKLDSRATRDAEAANMFEALAYGAFRSPDLVGHFFWNCFNKSSP